MNRRTKFYLATIIAIAALVVPFHDWRAFAYLSQEEIFGLLAVIGLGLLSEYLSVAATVGRHQATSSIAFIPFFASALLFPPAAAALATVTTTAVSQFMLQRRPPIRGLFNVSQSLISITVACAVFEGLGGLHSPTINTSLISLIGLTSFVGLSFTFFFVNQALVSVAIAFMQGERVVTVLSRVLSPAGGNIFYDMLASPVAVVVAILYSSFQTGGLLIGILPLLVIRHSYASNVKLQQANKDLLTVLIKAIETRDPYTSGHSIRVSILAKAIAEDMDLSAMKVERVEMAALVHDIGKVDAVYASIIRKEGGLTDVERKVIVTHAAKGAEFLETLTTLHEDVTRGVRHHHERYDGTGYPDGLQGEDIPLAGRIIQLCDSIDAMLSDRPYRKALTVEHVRGELLRCSGSQFDPKVVDVILKKNTLERAASLVRPEKGTQHRVAVSA